MASPDITNPLYIMSELLAQQKLWQFRRHPDWGRALHRAFCKISITLEDGRKCVLRKDEVRWVNLADQEFIDEIIRNEPVMRRNVQA